jgi:CheY-like chemotaxis protein
LIVLAYGGDRSLLRTIRGRRMNALHHAFESRSTVLVVEDDHDIRVSVRNLLEDEGYRVLTVTDGRAALDLLERAEPSPALIILDLMLPVMDGWEFAERLRALPRLAGIPIVIMSAYQEPPPPCEAVAFVRKPINSDVLLNVVDRYCA